MKPIVAVIAPGNMGAAVGARLVERGAQVCTLLEGRSQASVQRAVKAGMTDADDATIAQSDIILSIVPPGDALALAERLAPALRATSKKPVYVDCNAVSPQTAEKIAAVISATGSAFVDGGIIGGVPRAGYAGPQIYVSGPDAGRVEALIEYGLAIRPMDGPLTAASALKMSYGGITKGVTAICSAMVLAAQRGGVADALQREFAESQPMLAAHFARTLPDMFGKAYRWVAEMEEVADFTGTDAERDMYQGIAALYRRIADDVDGGKKEVGVLADFSTATKGAAKP